MTFDELRVLVSPDLQNPAQWQIHVQRAPRPMLEGKQPPTTPLVQPPALAALRNATAPPNIAALRALGKSVLESIMPPGLQIGLALCIDDAQKADKGLRLVVSILGNTRVPGGIGCHELPVEALFDQTLSFLATNIRTPISRGIAAAADRAAVKVSPPLKILVVASEPSDMPPVQAAVEKAQIAAALKPLVDVGGVTIDYCTPPTASELDAALQREHFHIVHFIGHGDFDEGAVDPNPQPYLYFEDGTPQRARQPIDTEQLHTILRNGNVPLIVMTACKSAASQPNGTEYPGLAFESLAQALVERNTGPLAAIAMQFDLETEAAGIFSGAFYRQLLQTGVTIDAAVAAARAALVARFTAGHRSWVNPTVYWRCIDGQLFNLVDTAGQLTAQQQSELQQIDAILNVYANILRELAAQPPDDVQATIGLRDQWRLKIQELMTRRGEILGDTVRLRGGTTGADGTIQCSLTLQMRSGARIGDVRVSLGHNAAEFSLEGATASAEVPAGSLFVQSNPGQSPVVLIQNASANQDWPAGEHVLGTITFKALNPAAQPIFRIPVSGVSIARNGAPNQMYPSLDAIVFAG